MNNNYPPYNQHQQPQQQPQYSYEYDPSQIQAYDQSYAAAYQAAYYPYNPQYAAAAAYYPDATQTHLQFQPEAAAVHPPGVNPAAPEPPQPRPTHAPTGPSQYRGRGGRGGRSYRGGGRGQFNRGRGRGLGGGSHLPSHSSGADTLAAAGASVEQPSSSVLVLGQSPVPKQAQAPAAPVHPPPPKAWCEICNVGCNTFEVMEQHKSGKKHLKNMKNHEALQRQKALIGQQSEQIPTNQLNLTDQPKKVQESEKNECLTENVGSEVAAVNHKDGIEPQNNIGETSAVPGEEPEGETRDNSAARGRGRGLKRKMRGGRGSKIARIADGSRRPVETRKPEQPQTMTCDLCNVKCESYVVYQSHMTGKRHLSNLKRVHGPEALSGLVLGLQALYPPDVNALSNAINAQVQQGDNDPQVLLAQLLMNALSQQQVPGTAPQAVAAAAAPIPVAPTDVAGSSYAPELSQTQASEIGTHVDALASSNNIGSEIAGGSSEWEQVLVDHPQGDGSVVTLTGNSGEGNN